MTAVLNIIMDWCFDNLFQISTAAIQTAAYLTLFWLIFFSVISDAVEATSSDGNLEKLFFFTTVSYNIQSI